jgi:SAM-dependent methyltransferase
MGPRSLEEKAALYEQIEPVFLAELDQSLGPRGSASLYDLVADMALPAGSVVLDAGCGKGRQLVELARRFDVRVVGVDPAPVHLEMAAQAVRAAAEADAGLSGRVEIRPGRVEELPIGDSSIDLVWCRDVLGLVADLRSAYAEFARVLRPGSRAIVYQSGLAPDLTEREAERFWAPLDAAVASSDPANVEAAIAASGLHLDEWSSVGLEWGEYAAEANGTGPRRLLHLSRLLREPDRYVDRFGRWAYDVMVADCLWHLYRMTGKLDERLFLLSKRI